jgi:hypothetical protein
MSEQVPMNTPEPAVAAKTDAPEMPDIPLNQRRCALGKEFHPFAWELFPPMNEREFGNLVESIRANGFYAHEQITLHEGKIVDGRNRALACEVAKVEPVYTELPSGVDPLQFVIAKNWHRRNLDESQRAVVAAKIATMKHGGDRKSDQDANLQVDRGTAAKMLTVSERSVASAAKVLADGAPELVQAVERGEVAVSSAAVVADLPKTEQQKVVAGGKRAVVKAAQQIKAKNPKKAAATKTANTKTKATTPVAKVAIAGQRVITAAERRAQYAEDEAAETTRQVRVKVTENTIPIPVVGKIIENNVSTTTATLPVPTATADDERVAGESPPEEAPAEVQHARSIEAATAHCCSIVSQFKQTDQIEILRDVMEELRISIRDFATTQINSSGMKH